MPRPIAPGRVSTGLSRRALFQSSSLGVIGLAAAAAAGNRAVAAPARYNPEAMAAQISEKLFADDGLARAAPDKPVVSDIARGLDRTLVLGGGGEYYVAWYCGFLHGLYEQKVDLDIAEMVVGTSAGAYAGSTLTSGHFKHLLHVFDFFGEFPRLFAKLAPVTSPNLSQKRAQEINFNVKDGSPASTRAIGHAALAADNHLNVRCHEGLSPPRFRLWPLGLRPPLTRKATRQRMMQARRCSRMCASSMAKALHSPHRPMC